MKESNMLNVKILGTGCANCKATRKVVEAALAARGIRAEVEKVEDMPSIMKYGVMSTPGVVIDGRVVHAGGVPRREDVESWLSD
jgi:small redox-active disulfide protein 2